MSASDRDIRYMKMALGLARRGLGRVAPNPAVGCVIVATGSGGKPGAGDGSGTVIGRGWTQPGGVPHAETEALAWAGAGTAGSTVYVTLEPCAHHGRTPPCTDALLAARPARVVVAMLDPNPQVNGAGVARLRAAGIQVDVGLLGEEAQAINIGFINRITQRRPMVTVKMATTIDGKIATRLGESKWVTGEQARAVGHYLRARHDAILIGSGTAVTDDPILTCRLPGLTGCSPIRVIADGRLRLPLTSTLVRTANTLPTRIFTLSGGNSTRQEAYRACGVTLDILSPDGEGQLNPQEMLGRLADSGITRLLVDGGSHLVAALLRAELVDQLMVFRSSTIIGGDGVSAVSGFGTDWMIEIRRFVRESVTRFGPDMLEVYRIERSVESRQAIK